jgi:hypothetical protein
MYETSSPILWQHHAAGMEHGYVQTRRSSPEAIWSLIREEFLPYPEPGCKFADTRLLLVTVLRLEPWTKSTPALSKEELLAE